MMRIYSLPADAVESNESWEIWEADGGSFQTQSWRREERERR